MVLYSVKMKITPILIPPLDITVARDMLTLVRVTPRDYLTLVRL